MDVCIVQITDTSYVVHDVNSKSDDIDSGEEDSTSITTDLFRLHFSLLSIYSIFINGAAAL
jgi:hypothetical protein